MISDSNDNTGDDIIGLILSPNEVDQLDRQLVADYTDQLSSLGVRNLTAEPHRLADARIAAVDRTQQLAYGHYKTFIGNADSTARVTTDFYRIEHSVDRVITAVPELVANCEQFASAAKDICDRWRDVSSMLSNHPQILEVLEIPQLMDTCVRNAYYEEALQLYTYVQSLSKKHGQTVPIIASIAKDVDVFREVMINQLLKELSSANIQLQNCLKIMGYLRRTDKFTETELRIKFLTSRDQWLTSIVKEIPDNNPLSHITKVIETIRPNLFDIINQFRAIFADTDPVVPQHYAYYGITAVQSGNGRDFTDGAIINSWVLFKVNQFLGVLSTDVNRCVNNEFGHYYPIESVIEPAFYFGLSMSRIGADFRPQLIPIINDAIAKRFARVVNDSTQKFETSIQSFTLTSHTINTTSQASLLVGVGQPSDQTENDLIPPVSLLEFPLLAHYCNDILGAMNEIRRTTPLSLISSLTNTLNESFQRLSNAISKYFRAEESGLSAGEREILYRFCGQYVDELLPHLCKCFEQILPSASVANRLGVSAIEFAKVKDHFPGLRCQSLADSVNKLLPTDVLASGLTIQ